jgi:H+-transporting ATPase
MYGRNELPEKERIWWRELAKQFWGPMPIMIWIAIIIEIMIPDWTDMMVLLTLQILNSTVAWHEDHQAGNAVAALKASLKPEAVVKRGVRGMSNLRITPQRAADSIVPSVYVRRASPRKSTRAASSRATAC